MQKGQIIVTSMFQALQELKVNKLRTFLSLLGVTIGIFCIIAVLTVVDSMKKNIQEEMATLGSDVLYINRWPWMDEGGEYKWWEFWRRPSMTPRELKAIENEVADVRMITLCLPQGGISIKHHDEEASGITAYAVLSDFDKLQNIEISEGRYLTASETDGGTNAIVIGQDVYQNLFPGNSDAVGQSISLQGRKFMVVGVLKKVGQNMAGFDFDNAVIYSYYAAASFVDLTSLNYDPFLIVKGVEGKDMEELRYEVEGVLRRVRKVRPGQPNDFAINQLSQVTERVNLLFGTINVIGLVIAGFSLVVGGFGIANIMFVTVRERTKIIGLKKAIGARPASILLEFLIEAVTLCLTGGVIGIIIVLLLSLILNYAADFPVSLSLKNFLIGVGISGFVGVLAGFIPARSASRLDPVVAIRSH
ncbi:MAG: FtsX-like permease family protein [Sphingobacteriales bacterium]|nr:MAG: FtsX-like permease family protein [Sphingobacteriales bacterium]